MLTRPTTALLEALLDPADDEIWQDFDRRYRPILIAFARRLGLPDEDAADAAHDTLLRILGPDHAETRAAATALEANKENST